MNGNPQKSPDLLDEAVVRWRAAEAPREQLQRTSRARILESVGRTEAPRPLGPLFFPVGRLALAGALPLVVLTLMLGFLVTGGPGLAPVGEAGIPSVQVSKDGSEVIFTIANGQTTHRVYRSGAPDRFDETPTFTTSDGAFVDRLEGGPDLVFYRID